MEGLRLRIFSQAAVPVTSLLLFAEAMHEPRELKRYARTTSTPRATFWVYSAVPVMKKIIRAIFDTQ